MRGLDTRVLLAQARIMQVTDWQKAAEMTVEVGKQAEKDGIADAASGVHTLPAMFNDELLLAMQWCAGQRRYEQGLDRAAWRTRCEKIASDANNGCGLSHDYYQTRFSGSVDWALRDLAKHEIADALQIAREFDYATVEEREEGASWNADNGYCSHGIELGCCPAGCDYPDDDFDDFDYESCIPEDVLLEASGQAHCGPTSA